MTIKKAPLSTAITLAAACLTGLPGCAGMIREEVRTSVDAVPFSLKTSSQPGFAQSLAYCREQAMKTAEVAVKSSERQAWLAGAAMVLGAATGAAIGNGPGAGIGAASGLLGGSAIGAATNGRVSEKSQDTAAARLSNCMASDGYFSADAVGEELRRTYTINKNVSGTIDVEHSGTVELKNTGSVRHRHSGTVRHQYTGHVPTGAN